jgi:hypothetical protein
MQLFSPSITAAALSFPSITATGRFTIQLFSPRITGGHAARLSPPYSKLQFSLASPSQQRAAAFSRPSITTTSIRAAVLQLFLTSRVHMQLFSPSNARSSAPAVVLSRQSITAALQPSHPVHHHHHVPIHTAVPQLSLTLHQHHRVPMQLFAPSNAAPPQLYPGRPSPPLLFLIIFISIF